MTNFVGKPHLHKFKENKGNEQLQQNRSIWATYTRERRPSLFWHTLPRKVMTKSVATTMSVFIPAYD